MWLLVTSDMWLLVTSLGGSCMGRADLASSSLIMVATEQEHGGVGRISAGLAAAAGRGAETAVAGARRRRGGGLRRLLHAKLSARQ